MFSDYHVHTSFSADGRAGIFEQLEAARRSGITHICFTDHVDFDGCTLPPADISARNAQIEELRPLFPEIDISMGVEIGMKDKDASRLAWQHLKGCHIDFAIGSVHLVGDQDVYYPSYFDGKTKDEAVSQYLDTLSSAISCSRFSVMGHYDFCVKYAPYADRSMGLHIAPELFDSIFTQLIDRGLGMEVNTAAWRDDAPWGLDVLRRYRELGGEFVTLGSDAHTSQRVGARLDEALELVKAAGVPWIATFRNMQPILHKI